VEGGGWGGPLGSGRDADHAAGQASSGVARLQTLLVATLTQIVRLLVDLEQQQKLTLVQLSRPQVQTPRPRVQTGLLPYHHGSAKDGQRAVQGQHLVCDVDLGDSVSPGGQVSQVSNMSAEQHVGGMRTTVRRSTSCTLTF